MKILKPSARVVEQVFGIAKRNLAGAALASAGLAAMVSGSFADVVDEDDFEIPLEPFSFYERGPAPGWRDGTDYTKDFPTGWTLDNSENTYDNTGIPEEYDGWSIFDVDSWRAQQGDQGSSGNSGRFRCTFDLERNTALVADPDALDDNTDCDPDQYNSYLSYAQDITGADAASLALSFDWDFKCEDRQVGTVEVSFDGGATYQTVLIAASEFWGNPENSGVEGYDRFSPFAAGRNTSFSTSTHTTDNLNPTQNVFSVANGDFTVPDGAEEMIVRFGCIVSGNDWWFCVDNIEISDTDGVIYFEDFEALADTLEPYSEENQDGPDSPQDPPEYPDGTDYTRDGLAAIGWEVINDGPADLPTKQLYLLSLEDGLNGWAAMDFRGWREGTGQGADTWLFAIDNLPDEEPNTLLVADPDEHDDDKIPGQDPPPSGEFQYNSFIQKRYDLTEFANKTVTITMDWEFRIEDSQAAYWQVSFDGGTTWTTIQEIDPEGGFDQSLVPFIINDRDPVGEVSNQDRLGTDLGPQTFDLSDVAINSNSMILRFGCINAGNDWWFAIDNVLVEADPQAFKFGDIDGDNDVDLTDFQLFTDILRGNQAYEAAADFNEDGDVTVADFNGWVNTFRGN